MSLRRRTGPAVLPVLIALLLPLAGCGSGQDTPADPEQAVCDWLEEELPDLATAGSNLGAQTLFADDWSSWVAEDGSRPRSAQELDRLSASGCPEAREQALTAIGTESFADVLG